MDYYTISGKNANFFYGLNLEENMYFNYNWVIDKVNYEEFKDKIENLKGIMNLRKERELKLREEFDKKGIKFQDKSYLVRRFIMYGDNSLDYVVRNMYMMKVLFEECDIRRMWEDEKKRNIGRIYTMKEKDNYYKEVYKNYVN